MAIDYDFYSSANLKGAKTGTHLRPLSYRRRTTDELAARIEKGTSASRADIRLVLSALADEMADDLCVGNSVHIEGIGTFRIRMKGTVERDKRGRIVVKDAAVRTVGFRPDRSLMKALSSATFSYAAHRGRHSTAYTEEELRQAAVKLCAEHGAFTALVFRNTLGLTRSKARNVLRQLVDLGVLRDVGSRRCAVYQLAGSQG